ncbi:ATP-binding protein [Ktedonobacter racemifer]|uniref:histidine kinase n=1 Tax=Ktedonobacter racemifer DSM 44963 TaxID=485913 RepID=D6U5C1_KTERA|nr:ATP-binding protein [Ktedonobacter racemifer]EFH81701.1 PAS/PAC sensor signal transduction histidine kinase [Ktedonobacter racemifer DSM 44963]
MSSLMNTRPYHYAETMLEHTPVGMAIYDAADFRLLEANSRFLGFFDTHFATQPAHKLRPDQTVADWVYHPQSAQLLTIFQQVKASGQAYQNPEFCFHSGEGVSYWSWTLQPVFDDQQNITHIIQSITEVTEQVLARQKAGATLSTKSDLAKIEHQAVAVIEHIARSLRNSLEIETVAQTAIHAIAHHIRPLKASLFVSDTTHRALRCLSSHQDALAEHHLLGVDYLPFESQDLPLTSSILQQREPVFITDLQLAAAQERVPARNPFVTAGILGYAYLPLWHSNRFEGALCVLFQTPIDPAGPEIRILRGCSAYIASAMAHARIHTSVEREQSYLQAVLDQLPEGILIVEAANATISYANEAAANILGLESQDVIDQPLHHYRRQMKNEDLRVGGQMLTPWTVIVVRALCGETIKGKEAIVVHAEGSRLITLASCAPFYTEDGIMKGAVVVLQDVTAQKTFEQHKNEFFSIANHELRTPITVIQGFAEILQMRAQQETAFDGTTKYALSSIAEQSQHLTHLIEEMLDISRIEQSRFTLQRQAYDLLPIITNVFQGQQVAARQHQLHFILRGLSASDRLLALVDEERLIQALNNLIGNAIKYSAPGSEIEVGLRYNREQEGDQEVVFWVRDQGIGIANDEIPLIFKRFYRARNVDQSQSGFGIGLYLVKEVISRHGGRIWVESKEGKGSTFYCALPIVTLQTTP